MIGDFDRYLDVPEQEEREPTPRRPAPGKVSLTAGLRVGRARLVAEDEVPSAGSFLATPIQRVAADTPHDDPFGWDSWGTQPEERVQSIAASGVTGPSEPLPHLDRIQQCFGHHDVSGIQAHVGGSAAGSSAAIGARAYATGNHVAFVDAPDLHTAAHEAAHVVQQRGEVQLKGGLGETGDIYERHADAVADKVVAGESAESLLDALVPRGVVADSAAIQRAQTDAPPEAVFLEQLNAQSIVQTPRPVRIQDENGATVHIVPTSALPLPATARRIPLYCKILDKAGRAVSEASGEWHPTFVVGSTFSLAIPAKGAHLIELHVNAGRPGARVLSKPLAIEVDREKAGVEREAIKTKLIGLEDVYRRFRDNKAAESRISLADPEWKIDFKIAASQEWSEITKLLQRHGFASLEEFKTFISDFERAFEKEAVAITKELLQQYAARIAAEAARYQDPAKVRDLHGRLEGIRFEYKHFERNQKIANGYLVDRERASVPGQWQAQPKVGPREAEAARKDALDHKNTAEEATRALSAEFPILDEEGLPQDRRIDKKALATASPEQLGALLGAQTARRAKDIAEALAEISSKPQLVYKMDKMMPQFYARQGITPGSIHDQIIRDKIHDDEVRRLAPKVLLAIVGIALIAVTAGTASPVVAGAAGAAGLGIGAYSAYSEYQEYDEQKDLADVGLAEDPSTAWLVLSIVGAGFDVGTALRTVKVMRPAAVALHSGGDVDAFARAIKELEKANAIDARIARTAEKAAAAKKASSDAFDELLNEISKKVAVGPGALSDPKVRKLLVDLAVAKIKQGYYTAQIFVDDLRLVRATRGLPAMSPEELTEAKAAWEQALAIARSAEKPVEIVGESGRVIGRYSNGSHLEIIPRNRTEVLYGGNRIELDPNATTTVTGVLPDVNKVAVRGERLPGATVMGENEGGINILRSPQWDEIKTKHLPILDRGDQTTYWKTVTDEFWETVNRPWLDDAIARGDRIRLVSDPSDSRAVFVTDRRGEFVLDDGKQIRSIFGREVDYLRSKGFKFSPDGTAVKEQ